jgi:phosphopantothenoylcysteine decarboxylase/phosphopantothenate--cysteine ligase
MFGKRILLGITGGIAAYKIAFLIRLLKKSGAEVKCIMTPASSDFISPLVVATLSENPVGIEFWDKKTGVWANHVEYGLWADLFVIAPLTANTLSKLATGASDNLLLATYLSVKCETIVAPAMDLDMYKHPVTLRNLKQLEADGVTIIPAESGELASGLVGEGRMAEPETIFDFVSNYFECKSQNGRMLGQKVIITAGPTYEAIDPVRFIGNHSSGKMGYELADACLKEGAEVTLISGPTNLSLSHPKLHLIAVRNASDMLQHVQTYWKDMNYGIFAAAVADYRPVSVSEQKIKKEDEHLHIELVKNPDILKWAGSVKTTNQLLIGFALETHDLVRNATLKLTGKNLDCIVMNSLEDPGAGFGGDSNKISILDRHNNLVNFELKSKKVLAKEIVDYMIKFKK